ncbi:MAG: hypothetical protein J9259_05905 [Thermoplasmata archaeon YP2-bin.285]|uniref:Uncharacterized protein n=1 Tax=Candidatus Sysuiplasma superficiale TaxID=2823368 RepID=A0A8J7YK84_9ARCH|nr:hypothetical protein [Candidatus Sysuiplasma superficiale]
MDGYRGLFFAFFAAIVLVLAPSAAVSAGTVAVGSVQYGHGKNAIVWMGLEITGEDISADLQSIGAHRNALTGVSFERYLLGPEGIFETFSPISNVTDAIRSFGLQTFPMIVSVNLTNIEYLLMHPSSFISSAVTKAFDAGYTGYNIDFEPTQNANNTVALEYSSFLTKFADALHEKGKQLTVDIATWNPFWNFSSLANTTVNVLYDMGTYSSPSYNFAAALDYAVSIIPLQKLGIGLITTNVNNGQILSNSSVLTRFQYLESYKAENVAVWDMPLSSYWWTYLSQFIGKKSTPGGNNLWLPAAAAVATVLIVSALAVYTRSRKRKK